MHEVKRADVRLYIGATGSGKGASMRAHLKAQKPARLVGFDPMHEWGDVARPVSSVAEAIRAMKSPRFAVVWQPTDDTDTDSKAFKAEFQLLCKAAFLAGDLTFLAEEVETFTKPTWAPPAWRNLTKRGRHVGVRIVAAMQRPADADKALLSSATYIRCFALREHEDRQRMAKSLSVDLGQIERLQTLNYGNRTEIRYFEQDYSTGQGGEKTITLRR